MKTSFPPPDFIQVTSKVDGIEVYAPAPADNGEPQQLVVDFACPQCGATTAFSAVEGGLKCSHCGYSTAPQKPLAGKNADEHEFTIEVMEKSQQVIANSPVLLECKSCGAKTSLGQRAMTNTCAFCGSNQVLQRQVMGEQLLPRFLIPFKFELERCRVLVQKWLGNSWMLPDSLQKITDQFQLNGVYMPYWTFDALTTATWKAEVGHSQHERFFENGEWKVRTVTVWRWESGRVSERFDDLITPATNRVSNFLIKEIDSFDLAQLNPYEAGYLAGYQALAFDIPLERSWEIARGEMREKIRLACRGQASSSQIRNFSMNLDFSEESWRYILLPFYLAGYRFRGKIYHLMVNGQSEQIAGQRPVDWTKIWLVVGAILFPGLLISLAGVLTIALAGVGVPIGGVGFVLLVIGLVFVALILRQAMAMDDI